VSVSSQEDANRQDISLARFGILLLSFFVAFAVAYFTLRRSTVLVPFLSFNARVSSFVANLFGGSAAADGVILSSGGNSYELIVECTSIIPTAILISAVLAWPSSLTQKFIGIAMGSAALFLVNIVRILTLLYVGSAFPDFLDIAHFYVWQALLVLLTVGLWLLWVSKFVRMPYEHSPG
jgi:exosortase H (IPTLxxWG-CTERM-specific)